MSRRAQILTTLAAALEARKYQVRKGFVNWAQWDWEKLKVAAAVHMDEGEIAVDIESGEAHAQLHSAVLTVELFTYCTRNKEEDGVDDERMEALNDDLLAAIEALGSHRTDAGGGLVSAFKDVRFVEANQAAPRIQGLICIFGVTY